MIFFIFLAPTIVLSENRKVSRSLYFGSVYRSQIDRPGAAKKGCVLTTFQSASVPNFKLIRRRLKNRWPSSLRSPAKLQTPPQPSTWLLQLWKKNRPIAAWYIYVSDFSQFFRSQSWGVGQPQALQILTVWSPVEPRNTRLERWKKISTLAKGIPTITPNFRVIGRPLVLQWPSSTALPAKLWTALLPFPRGLSFRKKLCK